VEKNAVLRAEYAARLVTAAILFLRSAVRMADAVIKDILVVVRNAAPEGGSAVLLACVAMKMRPVVAVHAVQLTRLAQTVFAMLHQLHVQLPNHLPNPLRSRLQSLNHHLS